MHPDQSLVPLLQARGFTPCGKLQGRRATDIKSSPWSIGLETIDRDYVDFAQTGPHLVDLGAKQARVQAGWAKCEPTASGIYNWQWLDTIVDTCHNSGVTPWLQTSYGNPAYPGGGGIGLAQGLPSSPDALDAWDRWVAALATRYFPRVSGWEIWNEPDIHGPEGAGKGGGAGSPHAYGQFFIRTATLLRNIDPSAHIIGLGLAWNLDYAATFLADLAAAHHTQLLNEITYHFYPHNPDDDFDKVAQLAAITKQHAPHVTLRQGETGSPSETRRFMALGKFDWNEHKQAAWNLRRLLAHHARGIPMNLFQLADMQYTKDKGLYEGRNSKGLLSINADKTVAYRKPSYFAAQHVFSLLDDGFPLRPLENLAANAPTRTSAYAWTHQHHSAPSVLAWWRSDDAPALETPPLQTLQLSRQSFTNPLLLDLLSGTLFTPPAVPTLFENLPLTDSPLVLLEKSDL